MGVYYDPKQPAIVPDGFLSLGVQRRKSERGRLSYVLWEEQDILPQLVLEVVSRTYGQEYEGKLLKYAQLGVTYYVVYNPVYWVRDKHDSLEIYRLVDSKYVRQQGDWIWLPEIGLGIGQEQGSFEGWNQEWLYWYDREGNRFPSPDERIQQEQRLREEEQRLREELIAKLRARGVDPDTL